MDDRLLDIGLEVSLPNEVKGVIRNYEISTNFGDVRYTRSRKPKDGGEFFLRYGIKIKGIGKVRYYWGREINK